MLYTARKFGGKVLNRRVPQINFIKMVKDYTIKQFRFLKKQEYLYTQFCL